MRLKIIPAAARAFRPLSEVEQQELLAGWQPIVSPGTEVQVTRVLRGAESIESAQDMVMAAPFILGEAIRGEQDGFDAVIIHCMLDPGLAGCREALKIPVVGEGQASFLAAVAVGTRFSILAPVPECSTMYLSNLRTYGLERQLCSIRHLGTTVLNLRTDLEKLKEAFLREGEKAVRLDGADTLVPGCGEIYGIAAEMGQTLGVPIIDPRIAAVKSAEMLVALGVAQSKVAYCSRPKRREL
jgi:allantoin racemase